MPVPVSDRVNSHAPNGVTTTFAYEFKILDEDEILVELDGVTQVGNYTVSGVGEDGGGDVVFSPAPTGTELVLSSNTPYDRTTDYQRNGSFLESTVDRDYDRIVIQVQQLYAAVKRAIKLPKTVTTDQGVLATPGTVVGFDALGNLVNLVGQAGSSLVDLAASAGASLIGFIQLATGAVLETIQSRLRWAVYVTDFLSDADRALLRAGTVVDISAATTAALAASAVVIVPDSAYFKFGSSVSIPDGKGLKGGWKHATKIAKAFNGTMITLGHQSFLKNLYLDGAGGSFTGRGIIITGTNGKQLLRSVKAIDFESYALDFTSETAGSQFLAEDCELTQVVGTSVGQEAVRIQGSLTASAVPRTFVNIQTQGKRFIDLGPCNNLLMSTCRVGDVLWSDNSRGVTITGSRLAGTVTPMVVKGANHAVSGCDVAPQVEYGAALATTTFRGNTYNTLPLIDTANVASNEFELNGVVDRFRYRMESGGAFKPFTASDTTPSIAGRTCWQTSNGSSTTITNFDDGNNGDVIIIRPDTNTAITDGSSTIRLAGRASMPVGSLSSEVLIGFIRLSNIWFELFRTRDYLQNSTTYDPPSLGDGVGVTTTVPCGGAALGDFAEASFSLDLQGISVTAWVSSADTVSVRFQNESGGILDLLSGTLRVRVRKS